MNSEVLMDNEGNENNKQTELDKLVLYPAYLVQSKIADNGQKDETTLVAIDVHINQNTVEWFDTTKGRTFRHETLRRLKDDSLQFSCPDNGVTYTLLPLSLERYNQEVSPHLYESRIFKDTKDMWNALLETRDNAW